jgi:hypothetical protein
MMTKRWIPGHLAWLLALWLLLWAQLAVAAGPYRFEGVERVVAVGDIHGDLEAVVTVLRGTGLVDEELRWQGGKAHLVSLGDLLDRGDKGRQVMDLFMRLSGEAAEAGGAVHVVHGNHEVMNLTGDLRYVSPGDYAQFGTEARDDRPAGFFERRAALAPDGEYGRWLLSLPVAIVIDDTLFVHGGISEALEGLTLEQLNEVSKRDIRRFAEGWHALLAAGEVSDTEDIRRIVVKATVLAANAEDPGLRQAGADLVAAYEGLPFVPEGPLWYRGNARCHPFSEEETTARVLANLGARRVVNGHTVTDTRRIVSRLDGLVILADTGMNAEAYQGRPSAVIIERGTIRAWLADEGEASIVADEPRGWQRPFGLDDAGIEAFLLNAEVVESVAMDAGRFQLTLEQDGRRLSAMFHATDTAPGAQQSRWRRSAEGAERWSHDLAAYRLDQLLGLGLVPVTVERQVGEQRGALRYLVEPSHTEAERQSQQIPFRGFCALADQFALMNLFDILILNAGQDLASLRYDGRGHLWLMDQSRAFGTGGDARAILRRVELVPSPQFATALAKLTPERLAPLKAYLNPRQVEALARRAEQIRSSR